MDMYNATNATCSTNSIVWQLYVPFASVLAAVIVVGNALTIIAVYKTEALRTITNMFIVSLAIADFVMIYGLIWQIISTIPALCFMLDSDIMNFMVSMLTSISPPMSLFNIMLIAVERYIFIIYPLHYYHLLTTKKAHAIILSSWITALLFSGSRFWWNDKTADRCNIHINGSIAYPFIVIIVCAMLYNVMIFCYGKILLVALNQRKRIRSLGGLSQREVGASDIRLLKMMLSVAGFCTISWVPVGLLTIINLFVQTSHGNEYYIYLMNLLYINSGVNVFIYAAKDKKFRSAYKKLLCLK